MDKTKDRLPELLLAACRMALQTVFSFGKLFRETFS